VIAAPEPIASVEEEETLDTSQPVPQPEPVAQIPAEPEADSEPEPELDTVEEALSDPQPEALKLTVDPSVIPAVAAVAEATPAPNPADAPEPPPAIAVDESAPEPQTAPEPLAEPEAAPVPSPAPAQESLPEPQPGPAAAIAPNSEPTPEPAPEPVVDEKAAARLAPRQKRLDDADEESPFSVVVDKVYDGPLDLLLDLIRKQDIDIYDIPIAKITAQFLAYVNQLKASDVDVAGEFIYTASLLIHIKSRMLLPRAPSGPDDTPEDPRRELVERLLEHERFKNAAQMLQQKQMLEAASWTNPGAREFKDDDVTEPEIAADTVDLVRIFRDILERARTRPVIDVTEDSVTVGQMIQFLARRLTMEDKPVALRRLLSHTRSERALIAMFLALLELVRLQAILLRQDRQFSEIFIKKHTGFDTVMNEGLANARDDWR
jgi:segregation and condensation protein A